MSVTADLSGKTAIVTGASSGIGRAIAERMGAAGAHVILSGRTAEPMEQSAALISAGGGRATVVIGDVRQPNAVDALITTALDTDGRLDIFVNNAGVAFPGAVLEGDAEQWQATLETNVLALLVGFDRAAPSVHVPPCSPSSWSRISPPSGESGSVVAAADSAPRIEECRETPWLWGRRCSLHGQHCQ